MAFDFDKAFNRAAAAADTDEEVLNGKKTEEVVDEQVETPVVEETAVETPSEPEYTSESVEEQEPQVQVQHETEVSYVTTAEPAFIEQIVNLSDIFRGFDDSTKTMAETFFNTKNSNEVLSEALAQNPITLDAFQGILDVDKAESVDKAFYLVDLQDDLLQEIGRVLEVLDDTTLTFETHNQYCRVLESNISDKDAAFMESLRSFLELLNEAQPKE